MISKLIKRLPQKDPKILIISISIHILVLLIVVPKNIDEKTDQEVWTFIPPSPKAPMPAKVDRTITLQKPQKVESLAIPSPIVTEYNPLEIPVIKIPKSIREDLFSQNFLLDSSSNKLSSISTIQTALPSITSLFGQEIGVRKLGVIWDVSKSMHPYLQEVFLEIKENFPQAFLILLSGSGVTSKLDGRIYPIQQKKSFKGSKVQKHFQQSTNPESLKMLEIFLKRPHTYHIDAPLDQASHIAFQKLIKEKIQAIYWFGDFRDPIETEYLKVLSDQLKSKQTAVYLHHPKGIVTGEKTIDRVKTICEILIKPTGGCQILKPLSQSNI